MSCTLLHSLAGVHRVWASLFDAIDHWFNRVPEANLGSACLPFILTLALA
jgi:hypothetical protein